MAKMYVLPFHPCSKGDGILKLLLFCFFRTIKYEVGDVLEILPGQTPDDIDAFIEHCNLNPESYFV
ncbi:NADPH-dependent diflavin oxidoreductase 1 isoform X1, partial [Tanacetum coccineum]